VRSHNKVHFFAKCVLHSGTTIIIIVRARRTAAIANAQIPRVGL